MGTTIQVAAASWLSQVQADMGYGSSACLGESSDAALVSDLQKENR